jgi:cyclic pyranopterin monophosphate synthase
MSKLSHISESGEATMVDVSDKNTTKRHAIASAKVLMNSETIEIIRQQKNPKGNVIEIAQTSNLIPLCHQIALSKVNVKAEIKDYGVCLKSEAITTAQTGVEMEALTAVSIAALTIYDMCKAVQKDMQITGIKLESKTGGKTDFVRR